ncbi:MAG: type II toxin-antitoxin system HicB family antitoxin [Candidatus Dadabacteria bacterium]|nr:type II toxin-antitoxin system HicB family antitoxin [Candidatus Dadabacteria bacterium]MCY4042371.1 type II toxin-antitoxin system HicB family antitoxin [Candidatus Dadabacteria bacterium]
MRYKVVLRESEEGYSVSCPAFRGCHSQGRTKEEALENIADAIQEYLAFLEERDEGSESEVCEVEIATV